MSRVAAVMLAAGSSRRMGDVNKLIARLDGRALIARAVSAFAAGGASPILVVLGYAADQVAAAIADLDVELVVNPDHASGMGTSIAAGVRALGDRADAVLIALGDMPAVSPSTIAALVAAHGRDPGAAIAPTHDGKRGHPVLFPASTFAQLSTLEGDRGARSVFVGHANHHTIDVRDPGVVGDIDTPEQLEEANNRYARPVITACAFDAYGTLFDVAGSRHMLEQALGERGNQLLGTWRRKQLQYTWLRSLMGAHVDFWRLTADALDYAMDATGVADPALRSKLLDHYRTLPAYADVLPTLERLRGSGVKTAILSNGEPTMLADAARAAGIADLLDDIISVEDVGVFKPDPRVYQLAVDRLDASRETLAFMTANAWDAAGAAAFGLQVVWVNRFAQPAERLPGTPIAEVTSLSEVPAALTF